MKTPELEKMHSVKERSQAQGEFIEWLSSEKGIRLCTLEDAGNCRNEYMPIYTSLEELLAEFHGIDLQKVEREKRALLESLRK